MNCFRQAFSCFKYTYAWLCTPKIDPEEEFYKENLLWKLPEQHTSMLWADVQTRKQIKKPLSPHIEKALAVLESQNIQKGVAVDLGCGISPTVYNLLKRGWKVYAVDNSMQVLSDLSTQMSNLGKKWFDSGQLIIMSQNIENFELPEKVHLVIATDSLPYCNPKKIQEVFCRIKESILPKGIAVFNLYSAKHHQFHQIFGTWTAKKSVIEAIIRKAKLSSHLIQEDYQFTVIASYTERIPKFGFDLAFTLAFLPVCIAPY